MSKPTLAVYGDSYADDKSYYVNGDRTMSKWDVLPHIGKSYLEMLEENFVIKRYAQAGSSLYYSLTLFEQTHADFDNVLFVVTEPGRFEVDLQQYKFPENNRLMYGPSAIELVKRKINGGEYFKEMQLINVLEEFYFPFVFKNPQQQFEHQILKSRISMIRPDAVVLDAFGDDDMTNLMSVQNIELRHWGITVREISSEFYNDMRKCHLTLDNHEVLAKALRDYFLNKIEFKLKDLPWKSPTLPVDHYRSPLI